MSKTPPVQISHESETQRQHARFPMAARVLIQGKEYPVKDLSAGGVSFRAEGPLARGKPVLLDLKLPFSSFSLGIPLEAEALHYNAQEKTAGFRFTNMKPEQISFLSYAIKSFIAGDIVTSGNILNIAARNNFTKARIHANGNAAAPSFRRQLPGLFLVAVLGFLIAAFIGGNLYNSMFIIRSADAAVVGPVIAVRAAANGIYRSKLDAGFALVQKNQTLGTITPLTGEAPLAVQSPCHCYITRTHTADGELAAQGQQVVSLMPIDAKPWVVAEIDPAQGKKIGPDSEATISVFGSRTRYTGRVVSMESSLSDARSRDGRGVLMKIVIDEKLPVDFVNRLAAVTFAIH